MGIWYCTREDVKSSLDVKETARANALVDSAIESSSRKIEGAMLRRFYPQHDTRTFDWPDHQYALPWRLWLDQHELISASAITTAGQDITADCLLRPDSGPPYNRIEINLGTSAAFSSGSTHQRSVSITGVYGYSNDWEAATSLAADTTSGASTLDVIDGSAVGVGSILQAGTEWLLVTDRASLSTGATLTADLASSASATLVAVPDGTVFHPGEQILIDGEYLLIVDIAGNTLVVKRAWDGSALAAHASGTAVYASRRLTVTRGALGTTAASHSASDALSVFSVPGGINELCTAESLTTIANTRSGYARVIGQGDNAIEAQGKGLRDLRGEAFTTYARQLRVRTAARPL